MGIRSPHKKRAELFRHARRRLLRIEQNRGDVIKNLRCLFSAQSGQRGKLFKQIIALFAVADAQAVLQHIVGGGLERIENREKSLRLRHLVSALDIDEMPGGDANSLCAFSDAPSVLGAACTNLHREASGIHGNKLLRFSTRTVEFLKMLYLSNLPDRGFTYE